MNKDTKPVGDANGNIPGFPPFDHVHGQTVRMALWPLEAWLQWQAEVLKITATASADWIRHRREGTEAALRALWQLPACESAEEAARVQSEWLAQETKRLESDIRSLSATAPSWLQSVVGYPGTWLSTERSGRTHGGERAGRERPAD